MDIQSAQDSSARAGIHQKNDSSTNILNQSMQSNYNDNKQQRNISFGGSINRSIGMGEFITCGTMFRSSNIDATGTGGGNQGSGQVKKKGGRNISKDKFKNQRDSKAGQITDLEK